MSDEPATENPGLLLRILKDHRIAFLAVGACNTLLGYALFVAFERLIGEGLGRFGYMVSLVCSYAIAIGVAFLLHRYLVFRVRGQFWLDFVRFIGVNIISFGLNAALLPLVVEVTGLRPNLAQAGVAGFVAIASYFGHRYFSFRRQPPQTGADSTDEADG